MLTFDIWGSCVTRDALEFILNCNINIYVSRQSIISACSQCLPIYYYKIIKFNKKIGCFHKRIINEDLYKTSLINLNNCLSNNILIIDLIDERNGLLTFNDNYITYSLALKENTNIESLQLNKINPFTNQYIDLFCKNIKYFSNKIKNSIDGDRKIIIIHKAYYADPNNKFIRVNKTLNTFYTLLEKYLPNATSIEVPCKYRLSSISHKWGGAPYHYIDEYYLKFIELISCNISQQLKINKNFTLQTKIHL